MCTWEEERRLQNTPPYRESDTARATDCPSTHIHTPVSSLEQQIKLTSIPCGMRPTSIFHIQSIFKLSLCSLFRQIKKLLAPFSMHHITFKNKHFLIAAHTIQDWHIVFRVINATVYLLFTLFSKFFSESI